MAPQVVRGALGKKLGCPEDAGIGFLVLRVWSSSGGWTDLRGCLARPSGGLRHGGEPLHAPFSKGGPSCLCPRLLTLVCGLCSL